ncbi:MAG: twin-arginine translocation signal domain-containing protein [Rhodospirillales bacterium]
MTDRQSVPSLSRRDLLKRSVLGASVAGAAAGVVAASGQTAEAAKPDRKTLGNKGAGYRETEHVRTYYELAKF